MANSRQVLGLLKSHVEGDDERFFDIAQQMADGEEQRGHSRLAEQLREWVELGRRPASVKDNEPTPIAQPRGELRSIIDTAYPDVRLIDLVLAEPTSTELAKLVAEFRRRDRLEEKGLRPRQRVLLTGPPGTGKTLSASALAGALHQPLFSVLLHGLISKYMGETAAKLGAIFDAIRTQRGVYLFDEIDALAATRTGGHDVGEARRILNSFLQFLDKDAGPSIVVATTNIPEILDRAILRRFDLVLTYELPTPEDIQLAMSRQLLEFYIDNIKWSSVLREADGLSTCDVILAACDAAREAVLASTDEISTAELVAAVARRRNSQKLGVGDGREKTAAPQS